MRLRASGVTGTDEVADRWRRHLDGTASEEQRLWTLLQYQLWWHTHRAPLRPAPMPVTTRRRGPSFEIRPARDDDDEAINDLLAAAMRHDPD